MTEKKVIVEFTLDPTKYLKEAEPVGDNEACTEAPDCGINEAHFLSAHTNLFPLHNHPDTQEAAIELVQAMIAGDLDICEANIVRDVKTVWTVDLNPLMVHGNMHAIIEACTTVYHRMNGQDIMGDLTIISRPPTTPNTAWKVTAVRPAPRTETPGGIAVPN